MADAPRRTLKVASVVGRVFEAPVLPGAYPELGTLDEVLDQLDELRAADLVTLDRDLEQAYLFKHVATQEVAYESLPFALRARLHGRVGRLLRALRPGRRRPPPRPARPPLLAERRRRAQAARTWRRAADAAGRPTRTPRRSTYLERLVPLLEGASRSRRS